MTDARVAHILAPSFLDGPGSRMAIFLQGCDLACVHCHNPETWQLCQACGACVPGCPAGALRLETGALGLETDALRPETIATPQAGAGAGPRPKAVALHHEPSRCQACDRCLELCPSHASPRVRTLTVTDLLSEAQAWAPYLDGVTFSGGECTLQWPFLLACLPRLRSELGLATLLDSNGNMEHPVLEALLPVTEGFLFDVKALDPELHLALTGVANDRILANLRRAAAAGKVTEVRSVLLPGATDSEAAVLELAQLVASLGPSVPLRLSPFRPQGVRGPWANRPALAPAAFAALCERARTVLGDRLLGT